MLTLFCCPKAFKGQFRDIQLNALSSWTQLRPRPEIVVLGDDEGTADAAEELGVRHVATVERNRYGTPLVRSVFETAEAHASHELMCYVNADIILTSDFMPAVRRVVDLHAGRPFLMVGRKQGLGIKERLDMSDPAWESTLRAAVRKEGSYGTADCDYFVFRKGLWNGIPPFAIGRFFWTQWLIWSALDQCVPVVDTTPVVLVVEPSHDYSHAASSGFQKRLGGREIVENSRLYGRLWYYTAMDATHVLLFDRLVRSPPSYWVRAATLSAMIGLSHVVKEELYPFSAPLLGAYRIVAPLWRKVLERLVGGI